MIWVAAAVLALLALAPAAWSLRGRVRVRERGQATVDLYRAQLAELDRDLAEGRIAPSDHATALLEVQRRLLAASDAPGRTAAAAPPDRGPLVLGMVLVPMAALALYLVSGRPELPAQPLAARMLDADRQSAETDGMVDQLRAALATIDPHSERARQGEVMLGNIEASRGRFADAASAWRSALDQRFDPMLAVLVADAASRAEGRVSENSAALFRRALAAAPSDAPWRNEVEQRLASLPPPAAIPR